MYNKKCQKKKKEIMNKTKSKESVGKLTKELSKGI